MKFSPEEDAFLLQNYMLIPAKKMGRMLGRSEGAARQRMKLLNISVPPEIIEKFRQDSYIKKGNVPANKGRKMADVCSPQAIEKMKATMFKPGQLPKNTMYDGAIVTRRDKTGRNYKWIRVSLANWKMLHVVNWEKKHGPVPEGYIIVFQDRSNTNDCEADKLECITLAENMRRNTIHNYPEEIKTSIRVVAKIKRQISKHEKQII